MSRDKVLPPKLSIKLIQDYLDMKKYPLDAPYQQLCDHANGKDFDLYLKNSQIDFYESNDVEPVNGALTINAKAKPIKLKGDLAVRKIKYENHLSLFNNNQEETIRSKPFFVEKIVDQGIEYYLTNTGSKSIGASFNENVFYSLRDEIINYRKNDIYKDTLDKNRLDTQFLDESSSRIDEKIPPYLDQDSDLYTEELHIAIQVNEALYMENQFNPDLSKEENVAAWLSQNRSDLNLSDAAIRRISAIISKNRVKRK